MADDCCASACGSAPTLSNARWRRILWVALGLNAVMFLVEAVAGIAAGSRSLQADSLDFLGDAANYAISLGVAGMALQWRARAAWIKGATILAFGVGILVWAIWGLIRGTTPDAVTMSGIGLLALVVNVSIALMLFRYRTGDANMRSVWICSRNDAINNILVIVAGLGIYLTASGLPDLIVALVMATLGIRGGWQVLWQANAELRSTATHSMSHASAAKSKARKRRGLQA